MKLPGTIPGKCTAKNVNIGGIGFAFRSHDCLIEEPDSSEGRLKDFIRPGKEDFIFDVHVGALPEYPKGRLIFEAADMWRLYETENEHIFETHQILDRKPPVKAAVCRLHRSEPRAGLYLVPGLWNITGDKDISKDDLVSWSLEKVMRDMGRLFFTELAPRSNAILIHAAGIKICNGGFAFLGESGAGKSTLSDLWIKESNAVVLSDDRLIVKERSSGFFLYGTPWPGATQVVSAQSAPLKKIFFLSHSAKNRIERISAKEAFRGLLKMVFLPLWDNRGRDRTLSLLRELTERRESFIFGFSPGKEAVDYFKDNFLKSNDAFCDSIL